MDVKERNPLARCFEGWNKGIAQNINADAAALHERRAQDEVARQIKAEEKRKRKAEKRVAK